MAARGTSLPSDGASLSIAIPNSLAGLKEGSRALTDWLHAVALGAEIENKAHLVFDEIVTNTIRYGFCDQDPHTIDISFALTGNGMMLCFEDDGVAFDPTSAPHPGKGGSLAEATVGGRGLLLVKNAAQRLEYVRTDAGQNRFTVTLARS